MISYIKGRVKFIDDNSICIDSNNIGWDLHVYVPEKYLISEEYEFYVYSHFRESEISLWAFESLDDLKCFKMLLSVSGVGPRTAQTLIGDKGVPQICYSIINNDETILKVPGVGLKTSQKIIIELKTKITKLNIKPIIGLSDGGVSLQKDQKLLEDLSDALITLGYRSSDIQSFISGLDEDSKAMKTEDLIKLFLKSI